MAGTSDKFASVGQYTHINTATTTQILTNRAVLERIIVVAGTVDIYDDPDSNDNLVFDDLAESMEAGVYLNNGLRVVTVGASVNVTIVWSNAKQ